jgi:hypothetical protein
MIEYRNKKEKIEYGKKDLLNAETKDRYPMRE